MLANTKSFLNELAFDLNIDAAQVTPEMPIAPTDWDSLAMFSTIGNVQRSFDVVVNANQLQQCHTIGELLTMIETRKG